MLAFGNERVVQQGEEWNLDILLSQSSIEYIPFIVSSQRSNPMWAITIASTKYEKNERYVATWWQDLVNGEGLNATPLPRFYQTVPDYLGELTLGQPIARPVEEPPMYALYQYTKAEDTIDPTLGHKPYYYVYFTADAPNDPKYDYECRIRMQFQSSETSEWGSQNYLYQITLVDTILMGDYIELARDTYPDLKWPDWVQRTDPNWDKPVQLKGESNEDFAARYEASWTVFRNNWIMSNIEVLFPFVKNRIPNWFQADIDIDAPVGFIDIPQVIMPPTKLQVNNNLRKII